MQLQGQSEQGFRRESTTSIAAPHTELQLVSTQVEETHCHIFSVYWEVSCLMDHNAALLIHLCLRHFDYLHNTRALILFMRSQQYSCIA